MGAVGCLCHALERYGTMDRPTVMRGAIALAADGWDVDWSLSLSLALYYDRLAQIEASRAIFFRPSGAPLRTATGFELSVAADLRPVPPPSTAEIAALRAVDPLGVRRSEFSAQELGRTFIHGEPTGCGC